MLRLIVFLSIIIALYLFYKLKIKKESFRSSKCYDCEKETIGLSYPEKCYDCEKQLIKYS